MNLEKRLERLENSFSARGGRCKCSGLPRIRHYREGDKEIEVDKREFPPTCPDCGGEIKLIQIIVVPPKLSREDWGEYASTHQAR
jgi:hypothetical protein